MRIIGIAALFAACAPTFGQNDLRGWTLHDPYERWNVTFPSETEILMQETAGSRTVGPGWVVSEVALPDEVLISLSLRVETGVDNDFVGVAFCRQDDAHMYLLDWKGGTQTFDWGDTVSINDDTAERGLKIKKIDGGYTRDGLWGGSDGLGVSTLAGPVDRAWFANTTHAIEIELRPGRIVVRVDGEQVFDVADASFAGGRITTYGFSQDQLRFFDVRTEDRDCAADFNGDGNLNVFDFLEFQTAFSTEDPGADLAAPFGVLNVFDFLEFQTLFSEGC